MFQKCLAVLRADAGHFAGWPFRLALAVLALLASTRLLASGASATLDFAFGSEGFVDTGNAGGTVAHSTSIGTGSLRLTNPAGWIWRGRLDVNTGSAGALGSLQTAMSEAGTQGGKLRFDIILTSSAATSTSGGFAGVSYLVGINQDSASGGGWDQIIATNRPASGFPVSGTVTIPVQINLVPTATVPVNTSDSVLSVRNASSWYQFQLGTTANNVSSVEWHIDNFRVETNAPAPPPPPPPPGGTNTLEAENGTLVGTTVSSAVLGYSGTGYVTSFDNTGDLVRWNFSATNGLYNLKIRFRSPFGPKGFDGLLNGAGLSGMFPQTNSFATFDAGLVELLTGNNTLEIGGGWNYYEIDRADLIPVPAPPPPAPVPATLVDPLATFAARCLMQDLVADYGQQTWSGQQLGQTSSQVDLAEINHVQNTSGRKPAIASGDLMDYSPSRVAFQGAPANYSESLMALENAGHVLALCWHWNAPSALLNTTEQPWWRGFYTEATTFDVAAAMANTNSAQYAEILRDIDAIALQLRKFSDAGIPLLWRPLHESEGGWFWWGAKGPTPFKQLWRLLYNRLTGHHGLHNLIWVLTSEDPSWYPGDDVVDIIGVDGYPADRSDALSPRWEALKARFDGRKLIALTEFGGVPDIERMQQFGVWWAYFAPWTGTYGPSSMPAATVIRIYQSPTVITLDELNAVPPSITGITRLANGAMELTGKGPRGATLRVLGSTDVTLPIVNWSQVSTGRFVGGVFTITDSQATSYPRRFYRAVKP